MKGSLTPDDHPLKMKRSILSFVLAVAIGLIHLSILTSPWGDRVELVLVDIWSSLRGPVAPPKDVVLLAMDESSYRILGLSTNQAWPRAVHAKMLRRLKELGAKRAVMDILFIGPSADPQGDRALADAIGEFPTVLGVDTGSGLNAAAGTYDAEIEEMLKPDPSFAEVAEKLALVKMPEKDGFIREFVIPRSHITQDLPTLYEAAAGVSHSEIGIPEGRDLVWFYGPAGTVPTYSYYRLLEEERPLPASMFKDKIVFVGLALRSGLGPVQKDTFKVPFRETTMFGVEIQAMAAGNVLQNHWIKRAPEETECLFMFVLTILFVVIVCSFPPVKGLFALVILIFGWALTSYSLFLWGFFLPGITLISLFPVGYLLCTLSYYIVTYRSQQAVEKAFRLYLPKEMAKEMSKSSKGLQLGGESIVATALFTDIAGFTQMAEGMSALEVSRMLNEYFTHVIRVVFQGKGTVIKFIGDAVFVIWGAPLKCEDHAMRAAQTALEIAKEVDRFNATGKFPALHTRIGINTGTMVVGNLGSMERFDYTAIGDSVNLAARLEGLNKYFGTTVMLSSHTFDQLSVGLETICLGKIKASGKTESIAIYTVFENLDAKELHVWDTALTSFQQQEWESAQEQFSILVESSVSLNKAASLYLKEIEQWKTAPPPETWQGEVTFTSK